MVLQPKVAMRYKSKWRRHEKKRDWMEDYDEIVDRFPEFILEGKDVFKDRWNAEDGPRRSAKILFFFN
ncbi:hypothetical protein ACOSP7_028376 [Xanthoceras sorbifolium]